MAETSKRQAEAECRKVAGLLAEQAHYYREQAGEYEDWWFRRGRYDRGADANARWLADALEVEDALERFRPGGAGAWGPREWPTVKG